jgi:hypothetical protein
MWDLGELALASCYTAFQRRWSGLIAAESGYAVAPDLVICNKV